MAVRITHACICGSNLWFYRRLDKWQLGWRTGHEWMGVGEVGLATLQQEGKIRHVGLSNVTIAQLKQARQMVAPRFSAKSFQHCRAN